MRPQRLISFEKGKLDLGDKYIVQYGKASFYEKPRPKFDLVYAPSHPKIEADYEKIGKKVYRPSQEDVNPDPITDDQPVSPPSVSEDVQDSQEAVDESPVTLDDFISEDVVKEDDENVHFSELKWPKLRSLAASFSDEPVMSKEQAKEILAKAEADGKL